MILFSDCSSKDELDMFIAESVIMKNFKHENILDLIGVSYGVENAITRPYIILPFMVNRDLKAYLQCKRKEVENNLEALLEVCIIYMYLYSCMYCIYIILLYKTRMEILQFRECDLTFQVLIQK